LADITCQALAGGRGEETVVLGRRRERKDWKVAIHDLSGSAVATLFMPATGYSSWRHGRLFGELALAG
jgi:hypothetical protein